MVSIKDIHIVPLTKKYLHETKLLFESLSDEKYFATEKISDFDGWFLKIANAIECYNSTGFLVLSNNKVVGICALVPMKDKTLELVFAVDKPFRKKGLTKKLSRMTIDSVNVLSNRNDAKDLKEVIRAHTNKNNIPSIKIIENLGFKKYKEDDIEVHYKF